MHTHTILATGVFDILHDEHIQFLKRAKALGGKLVVGLESDVRVRQLKGVGRPINTQEVRVKNLEQLKLVDEVFILPEVFDKPEHHRAVLAAIKPDILAVSSHSPHLDAKRALMRELDGSVVIVHQQNPVVSTTLILAQQKSN